jgi:hypothetical protein
LSARVEKQRQKKTSDDEAKSHHEYRCSFHGSPSLW